MSAPSAHILRFRCRQDTYHRGKPTRRNWLKAERRAFHAYLKYACKKEYVSNLEYYEHQRNGFVWREYYRPNNGYSHGYPSFWAPRCQLRDAWERRFTDHRNDVEREMIERANAAADAALESIKRRALIR